MTAAPDLAQSQPAERLIEGGLFRLDAGGQPRLIGSRCRACGTVFAGRRAVCLSCFGRELEETLLGPAGKVHSFTTVHQQSRNSLLEAPYMIAQVILPEGVIVTAPLVECSPAEVAIGMAVETGALRFTEPSGDVTVSYAFVPARREEGKADQK